MSITNTTTQYGSIAKFFHWLLGLWIIGLLVMGFFMIDMPPTPLKSLLYGIHKSSGLTILFLMVLRLLWRQINTNPLYPTNMPIWQARIANWTKGLLYITVFLQTFSGWIMSTSSGHIVNWWWAIKIPMPGIPPDVLFTRIAHQTHTLCGWTLVALISLHTLGALDHWWIRRDGVFERMLPSLLKKRRYYDTD